MAELAGSVGAHVPAADRRGEAQRLFEVLAQRDVATDVNDVRVPWLRKARISSGVIVWGMPR